MRLKNGQELLLCKPVKEDAKAIINYLNIVGGESDNLLFGLNEFTMTIPEEEKFIEKMNSSETSILLIGRVEGEIVCIGSISSPARKRIAHQGELGISVKKDYWGLGIGTHLINEIIQSAKETNTLEIIHLGVKDGNKRAIDLYKKIGFEQIGIYKNFFKIDGVYYDEILMNLYL